MPQYQTYIELPIEIDWEFDDGSVLINSIEISQGKKSDEIILDGHAKDIPVVELENHLTQKRLKELEEEIMDDYDPTKE